MYISAKKYIINILSDERNKRFTINTLINFITRFGVIGVNLLMVPLLLSVVGKERFGIWQTILVVISWSSLLNFGLGNGVRNLITKLIIEKRHEEIGPAIGSALKIISKIVFFASIFIIPGIYFLLNPDRLFSGNQIPEKEVIISFSVFAGYFLLNIILSLSSSIAYGFQKSAIAGITNLSYLLLCYLSILIAIQFTILNLIDIAFIFGSLQSLVFLVSLFWQVKRFDIKINLKEKYSLSSVYNLSGSFFAVQLLSILFFSIDNFVISITLGASQTAEFSILSKIFYAIIGVFSVLLIQLWNSVTEANIKNNNKWIINIGKRLALFAMILFLGTLIISTFKDNLLHFWLGNQFLNISYTSFYLFSIYTFVHCLNAILANIQNGLGELKLQMASIFISLVIYITGCFILDVKNLGYNYLIVLKIIGTVVAIGINLISVRNLQNQNRTLTNEI
jgi:O-antigen/teichoic acid export membrane protein